MTRHTTAAVLFLVLATGPVTKTSTSSAVALRIESLSQREVRVQVASQPAGLWLDSASAPPAQPQPEIVARTPAAFRVADSVRTLNVLVLEAGAVRLRFGEGAGLQDRRLAVWGRDITLTRGPDGHFHSVWKAQRLVP